MLSPKRKLLLVTALLCLMSLAWVGCRGFFVNPTLTSITVTPASPNLQVGGTLQLTATGNNDDGSTKNLTSSATWTSSDNTQVTVSSTGLVKGIANTGTTGVTITATSGTISGTDTVTVGQSTTITITCDSCTSGNTISLSANGGTGTNVQFTAQQNGANVNANWTSEKDIPKKFRDHAWFVAFAPVENPTIAVAVLAEHMGHGGSAAAPLAKELIETYIKVTTKTSAADATTGPARLAKAGTP